MFCTAAIPTDVLYSCNTHRRSVQLQYPQTFCTAAIPTDVLYSCNTHRCSVRNQCHPAEWHCGDLLALSFNFICAYNLSGQYGLHTQNVSIVTLNFVKVTHHICRLTADVLTPHSPQGRVAMFITNLHTKFQTVSSNDALYLHCNHTAS